VAYSELFYTSTASGTYGKSNEYIGLIKDLMLNDAAWSCISDNNPDTSVSRVVDMQHAYNGHIIRMTGGASAQIIYSTRNLANNLQLCGYNTPTLSNITARLIYGGHISVVVVNNYPVIFAMDSGSDVWYVTSYNATYANPLHPFSTSSDTIFNLASPAYISRKPNGDAAGSPHYLNSGFYFMLTQEQAPYILYVSTSVVTAGSYLIADKRYIQTLLNLMYRED
jgi:hypothetical protein